MARFAKLSSRVDALSMAITSAGGKSKLFNVGLVMPTGKLAKVLSVSGPCVAANDCEPDFSIPYTLKCLLYPKRFKVLYGGRGSAKTRTVVAVLVEIARSRFERILCCREIQKSISASSKQELEDEIERRGFDDEFKITDSQITHLGTGSTFSFEGLFRNKTKIKGYAGATIVWVEEAEDVSRKSWDYLIPTIRAKGSEIWVTFNPSDKDAATWQQFCEPYVSNESSSYEDDRRFVVKINYDQNPWLTQELIDEREDMRQRDYDRYLWIWEGEFWTRSEAQVFAGKWVVEDFIEHEDINPLYGADWGFARDPSVLVRSYIKSECLYITHEVSGVGVELDDHRPMFLKVPGALDYTIRGDCSRPETISHLRRPWINKAVDSEKKTKGFRVVPCKKWSGSVEDGVEFVRTFKRIYIHTRCKLAAREFAKYSYKVDPNTDDVLPVIKDTENHLIDALRYSLGPFIGGKSTVTLKDIL